MTVEATEATQGQQTQLPGTEVALTELQKLAQVHLIEQAKLAVVRERANKHRDELIVAMKADEKEWVAVDDDLGNKHTITIGRKDVLTVKKGG